MLARREQASFHQHGRHGEHVGDVVEAVSVVVRRKLFGGIDFHAQHGADGVAVFRAIQAMDQRSWQDAPGSRDALPFAGARYSVVRGQTLINEGVTGGGMVWAPSLRATNSPVGQDAPDLLLRYQRNFRAANGGREVAGADNSLADDFDGRATFR